jgi:hypothetical protein
MVSLMFFSTCSAKLLLMEQTMTETIAMHIGLSKYRIVYICKLIENNGKKEWELFKQRAAWSGEKSAEAGVG